jgi:hypothetical protein
MHCQEEGKFGEEHTNVVDLAAAGVDGLEQLVDLVVAHLLAQVGQDCGCVSVTCWEEFRPEGLFVLYLS